MSPSRPLAPRRRLAAAPAGAAAVVVLAACAGSAAPRSPTAPAPGEGLSAVAVYGRHAAARGAVDVRLANAGPGEVRVTSLQVRHPGFEPVPPLVRTAVLPPDGRPRIVPVPFGAPRCDRDAGAVAGAGAEVALSVRDGDAERDLRLPLADGDPGLGRALRAACAAADVTAVSAVELGPEWVAELDGEAPRVHTVLHLRRLSPGGPVRVDAVGGTVLFAVAPSPAPLLVLGAGETEATAEVVVTGVRCDPHALTEAKRATTFPVLVALDGREPVPVAVPAPEAGRAALAALVTRACRAGS